MAVQFGRLMSIFRLVLIMFISYVVGQVCTYYGEYRYAEEQSNLTNCTWYRSKACCRRTEVSSVFGSMFKIHYVNNEKNPECDSRLNYMMCYFCSPNQVDWYDESQVVICSDFCEETYEKCKTARLGDYSIGEMYESGHQFCEANNFNVVPGSDRCFNFDPSAFDKTTSIQISMVGFLSCLCVAVLQIISDLSQ